MSYAAHSAGRLLDHLRRRAHTLHRKRWPRLQTRSGSRTTLTVLRKPLFATVCPPFACRRSDPYRAGTSAGPEETRATDHRAPKGPPRTAPPTNTRRNSRRTISLPTKEGRSMSPPTVTRIHRWMEITFEEARSSRSLRDADKRPATTLRSGVVRCSGLSHRPVRGRRDKERPAPTVRPTPLRDP